MSLNQAETPGVVVAAEHGAVDRQMSGVRAGLIVLVGMVVANFANYGFQVLTAHALGPIEYGDVAMLSVLIGLPLGGVQVFVARRVARDGAHGGAPATGAFLPSFGSSEGDFPVPEEWSRTLLSLPMFPELQPAEGRRVADVVTRVTAGSV